MQAWVITDHNGFPVGIRETEQDVIEAALPLARQVMASDDEHTPEEARQLVLVPEFDGDYLTIAVFLGASFNQPPYMYVNARKFDSATPAEE
jgi:hypothetical protein